MSLYNLLFWKSHLRAENSLSGKETDCRKLTGRKNNLHSICIYLPIHNLPIISVTMECIHNTV